MTRTFALGTSKKPSVQRIWEKPSPDGTIRAATTADCYTITGLTSTSRYEYFVGIDSSNLTKTFSIKNNSVSHKLKVTLNLPGFLKSNLSTSWIPIAQEGESFTVGTNEIVRYGVDTRWVELAVSGVNICNNETFGDPAYGTIKRCELASGIVSYPSIFLLDEDASKIITLSINEVGVNNLVMQNLSTSEVSEMLGVSVEVVNVAGPVYIRTDNPPVKKYKDIENPSPVTPSIVLSNSQLYFTATAGDVSVQSQPVNITNGGDGVISNLTVGPIEFITETQNTIWLRAVLNSHTTPAVLTVTPIIGTLPNRFGTLYNGGTYRANIPISSDSAGVTNSPQIIAVTFAIRGPYYAGVYNPGNRGISNAGRSSNNKLPVAQS